MVGKCVTKENPKSELDLDKGFVKSLDFPIVVETLEYGHTPMLSLH